MKESMTDPSNAPTHLHARWQLVTAYPAPLGRGLERPPICLLTPAGQDAMVVSASVWHAAATLRPAICSQQGMASLTQSIRAIPMLNRPHTGRKKDFYHNDFRYARRPRWFRRAVPLSNRTFTGALLPARFTFRCSSRYSGGAHHGNSGSGRRAAPSSLLNTLRIPPAATTGGRRWAPLTSLAERMCIVISPLFAFAVTTCTATKQKRRW